MFFFRAEQESLGPDNLGRTIVSGQWWKIYRKSLCYRLPMDQKRCQIVLFDHISKALKVASHDATFWLTWRCDLGVSQGPITGVAPPV